MAQFDRTFQITTDLNNKQNYALGTMMLGETFIRKGKYNKAKKLIDEAKYIFKTVEDQGNLSYIYLNQAIISIEKNDKLKAKKYLDKSKKIAIKAKNNQLINEIDAINLIL